MYVGLFSMWGCVDFQFWFKTCWVLGLIYWVCGLWDVLVGLCVRGFMGFWNLCEGYLGFKFYRWLRFNYVQKLSLTRSWCTFKVSRMCFGVLTLLLSDLGHNQWWISCYCIRENTLNLGWICKISCFLICFLVSFLTMQEFTLHSRQLEEWVAKPAVFV